MKTKGFTLIELLAVIVILAVMALIATPIVLNIIKDARVSSNKRSKEMYISAVENSVGQKILNNSIVPDGIYKIMSNGNLCNGTVTGTSCTGTLLEPEINGAKPLKGIIGIVKGKIVSSSIIMKDEKSCNVTSGTGTNVGDVITCGGENFYVISSDATSINMITKYNLNVGNNKVLTEAEGLQSATAKGWYPLLSEPYPGSVAFSNSTGWASGTDIDIQSYDGPNKLAINDYKIVLQNLGLTVNNIRLITKREIEILGNNGDTLTGAKVLLNTYPWLYSSSFWSCSTTDTVYLWYVNGGGYFGYAKYDDANTKGGVRPVITILKSEL